MSNTKLTKMNNAEAVSPVIGVIADNTINLVCINRCVIGGETYGRDIT
jgi:hypothetical protein